MYNSDQKSKSRQFSAGKYSGCGGVGRNQSIGACHVMSSKSRSASCGPAESIRKNITVPTILRNVTSRPGSAKDWVQQCQNKREREEYRKQEWDVANSHFKANQFHANFFNALPAAPRLVY